ncbi:ammonium transporter [Lutimaribacter sp. EGI FJ00015]|uniref:Ammonium transporter n=1 Tax=Lutimaribacter degradans TaxID=2945989 RepID=A0ACC5ZV58_9RHOB|nr:ammonium transporter [Lutimaribacter sp. EGI FJ00013]MCM2561843.1 ammonium transporter [Lutimaribacter sp. EGI FJ00013]MCO0613125.1 ammonium transporter [Lutimaribacter sp. EGI FJ00015]MCO0635675.1 ammonium transporter [Lutimaribacter sp. EGI FJ00014]
MKLLTKLGFAAALAALPSMGLAQEAEAAPDINPYIFTTLLFLIGGFLVFWMAAGFAMLEAGLVRSKNVTMQLTKNIALFSIAAIMYWLIGFNLMYPGEWMIEGWMGPWFAITALEPVGLAAADASLDYASVGSDFFFQLMFCATTASIVSGTLAERIKLWPFLIFVVILTGIIYPIEASWQWGGGWLSEMGFSDFAGSTLVHAAGGFAALAGALVLGPRIGKYNKDGKVVPIPGSNLALATLGTFILWLGWFGFNGGSQLAMGTVGDVTDVSRIFANTNMAAAAGAIAALLLSQALYKKPDLTMTLNGALAGLVSITAEPLAPSLFGALWIGAIGGIIVVVTVPMLDKLKIDDVVGAIPVHLLAGIWGTFIVPVYNTDASFGTQIVGIVAIGAFVFVVSLVVWLILKAIMGIRVGEEEEINGLDMSELGMEAYPEFSKG